LKEQFVNEKHNLSDLKTQYNAYKETNKALEEQIRDLQVILIWHYPCIFLHVMYYCINFFNTIQLEREVIT